MKPTESLITRFHSEWVSWIDARESEREPLHTPNGWERYVRICATKYGMGWHELADCIEVTMLQTKVAPPALWRYFQGVVRNTHGVPKVEPGDIADMRLNFPLKEEHLLRLIDGDTLTITWKAYGIDLELGVEK